MCVAALRWTANSGKLLDIYLNGTDQAAARLLISRFMDSAQLSTEPFRSDGLPLEMWKKGELTPSLVFDAGFSRAYIEKPRSPPKSINIAELKRKTEGCLSLTQSLADCADAGRAQGSLAYLTQNELAGFNNKSAPKSEHQGPDTAQTEAAIDRKFVDWSQSWSMDHYRPGSAHITDMNCRDGCKVSGRFSFIRFGAIHTIDFLAV